MKGERIIDMRKDLPGDFYSITSFTDKLLEYLAMRSSKENHDPFFAYLPFTAPHWPLQAPREVVMKYRGVYDDGPEALTQRRLHRLIELGLIPAGVEHAPSQGVLGKEWVDMTKDKRAISAHKMEVFAAMVDLINQNFGRVVEYLSRTGELDNTFILFISDNGAEEAALEALSIMGGLKTRGGIIEKYYDNCLVYIGKPTSFVWYSAR